MQAILIYMLQKQLTQASDVDTRTNSNNFSDS